MTRLLLFLFLLTAAWPARPAAAQAGGAQGLPARPTPFRFVTDQAQLLSAADAKKLESGLRRYADETGTQVVVVTVPSLGGRSAADYSRALGTAWGVGQRGKNNGLVVLVAAQDHQVAIQPGSGLRDKITPVLTQRVISQDFGPNFKQNNYFAGLRKGLSTLMLAANPSSDPRKNAAGAAPAAGTAGSTGALGAAEAPGAALNPDVSASGPGSTTTPAGGGLAAPAAPAEPTGPGLGTLLLGVLGIGAVGWLLLRLFRRNSAAGNAPDFRANQPNFKPNQPGGGGVPNFLPNQPQGGNYGPGYNNGPGFGGAGGSGPGIGGMLATGAAAAAGAYLGNRLAGGGHDQMGANDLSQSQQAGLGGAGAGGLGAGAGTAAADDYFGNRGGTGADAGPDYFSGDDSAAAGNGDYFSGNDDSGSSSYDDTSSDDTGGGGFDGGDDNSGSW